MARVFVNIATKLRKNERKANENNQKFSLAFPSANNFGAARVTECRAQNKKNLFFFMPRRSNFAKNLGKVTEKDERRTKRNPIFFGELLTFWPFICVSPKLKKNELKVK